MTAMPEGPPFVRDDLCEALAALAVMPGFRAELVDGEIIVSTTPTGRTRPSSWRSMIDRLDGKATIFSEPRGDDYMQSASVALGKAPPLPEPLGSTLPTGRSLPRSPA